MAEKCNCDSAKQMPELQKYLLFLQNEIVKHAQALNIPMDPNPMDEVGTTGSGGTGGDGKSAGWGNGSWP